MSDSGIDLRFIGAILTSGGIGLVLESQITREMIYDEGRKAFDMIIEHYSSYTTLPLIPTAEAHIGVSIPKEGLEPLQFYIDRIIKRERLNRMKRGVVDALKQLKDVKDDECEKTLSDLVVSIQEVSSSNLDLVNVRTNTEDRWRSYLESEVRGGGPEGIATPWPGLTKFTNGFCRGDFWLLLAGTNIGKSMVSTYIAQRVFSLGYHVMYVTTEMRKEAIARRFDAAATGFEPKMIRNAQLPQIQRNGYRDSLDKIRDGKTNCFIVGSRLGRTAADIELLARQHKPDMVIIDGAYRLQTNFSNQKKYERVAQVADQIQKMSLNLDIPVLATSQFNRSVKLDDVTADLQSIGYAYELAQNADIIISLTRDQEMTDNDTARMKMMKNREDDLATWDIKWKIGMMDFTEIMRVNDDGDPYMDRGGGATSSPLPTSPPSVKPPKDGGKSNDVSPLDILTEPDSSQDGQDAVISDY